MPGRDIVVIEFSAGRVEAPACLPNILRRSVEPPAFHIVHEQSIALAAAERT